MGGRRPVKPAGVFTALVIATAKDGIEDTYFVSEDRLTTFITFLAKAVVGTAFLAFRLTFLVELFLDRFFLVYAIVYSLK